MKGCAGASGGVSLPFLRAREEFSSFKSRRGERGGSKRREGGRDGERGAAERDSLSEP